MKFSLNNVTTQRWPIGLTLSHASESLFKSSYMVLIIERYFGALKVKLSLYHVTKANLQNAVGRLETIPFSYNQGQK